MIETPWDRQRQQAEGNPKPFEPLGWGPFHRHFASGAIHRDGHSECDQPGTPRRVYAFDPDYLHNHELAVARYAIEHPAQFDVQEEDQQPEAAAQQELLADVVLLEAALAVLRRTSRRGYPGGDYSAAHWASVKTTLNEVAQTKRAEAEASDRPGH